MNVPKLALYGAGICVGALGLVVLVTAKIVADAIEGAQQLGEQGPELWIAPCRGRIIA